MAGMNSHLHLNLETNLLNKLKQGAGKKGISVSELCRRKLEESLQLDRIERKIEGLIEKTEKSKIRLNL